MMRTWAEQQAYEHTIRLEWLKELESQDVQCGADLAALVGMDRGAIYKMAKRFNVTLPTIGSPDFGRRISRGARGERQKPVQSKPIITFAEQRKRERQARLDWLKEIASADVPYASDIAKMIGMNREQLYKMASQYGINLPNRLAYYATKRAKAAEAQRLKEAEEQRIMQERQARYIAAMELQKRKRELMKRGYTEQQALKMLADQLGVAA